MTRGVWGAAAFCAALSMGLNATRAETASAPPCRPGSQLMARSDLYFGAGGPRHASAWRRFLRDAVTPRFPKGFTVLDGYGQWHGHTGLTHEASHVLILFYPPGAAANEKLEAIRRDYKAQFKQQSVLRADSEACVAF